MYFDFYSFSQYQTEKDSIDCKDIYSFQLEGVLSLYLSAIVNLKLLIINFDETC